MTVLSVQRNTASYVYSLEVYAMSYRYIFNRLIYPLNLCLYGLYKNSRKVSKKSKNSIEKVIFHFKDINNVYFRHNRIEKNVKYAC